MPSNDEIFKKNVLVHLVNHAFPYLRHVWGAILMDTFFCIQYALRLSSSEASRALACQQSRLLPWLQNEWYSFAPHICSAPFLLLLPCIVPSSAVSPGPSLISQGSQAVWKRGLLLNRQKFLSGLEFHRIITRPTKILSFGRNL